MSQRFAGLTIIAIMPNIAEVVNAMIFAYNNNITLAMEIGSVSAIQVSLIQMPFLVMLSYVLFIDDASSAFALIFPPLDVFAVFVAVIILAYIVIDGRCNYFEGSALVLVYIVLIAAFYFQPNTSVKS
jgi:Ca2+:H+ antiporter